MTLSTKGRLGNPANAQEPSKILKKKSIISEATRPLTITFLDGKISECAIKIIATMLQHETWLHIKSPSFVIVPEKRKDETKEESGKNRKTDSVTNIRNEYEHAQIGDTEKYRNLLEKYSDIVDRQWLESSYAPKDKQHPLVKLIKGNDNYICVLDAPQTKQETDFDDLTKLLDQIWRVSQNSDTKGEKALVPPKKEKLNSSEANGSRDVFLDEEVYRSIFKKLDKMMTSGKIWDLSSIEKNLSEVERAQIAVDAEKIDVDKLEDIARLERQAFIQRWGKLKKSDLFFEDELPQVNELLNKLQLNELFEDNEGPVTLKTAQTEQETSNKVKTQSVTKGKIPANPKTELKTPEVIRKIMAETHKSKFLAGIMAERLNHVHPKLRPNIEAWIKGETPQFEFKNVTLDEIMKKEHSTYVEAIFSMSVLLKSPKLAKQYKDFHFLQK
jgi:hypothetical protein